MNKYKKKALAIYKDTLSHIELHAGLMEYITPIADRWVGEKRLVYVSPQAGGYTGITIDLLLAGTQSIEKDVNLFLDDIDLSLINYDDYVDGKWIAYHYRDSRGASLHVFALYGNTSACAVIDTGKTTPVYERVCT
jgi:hypothetical protein